MIVTLLLVTILGAMGGWALHLDMKRADKRRRARATREALHSTFRSGSPNLQQIRGHIQANRAAFAATLAVAAKSTDGLARRLNSLRSCRICRILGRVGLAPHARHYQPRHRASRA